MTTKRRIEVRQNATIHTFAGVTPAAPVKVIAQKAGPVTWLDKAKAYYHALIVLVGSLLVTLNEVTPLLNFLPDNGKQWVTGAIAVLTVAATALKSNEHWVDDL